MWGTFGLPDASATSTVAIDPIFSRKTSTDGSGRDLALKLAPRSNATLEIGVTPADLDRHSQTTVKLHRYNNTVVYFAKLKFILYIYLVSQWTCRKWQNKCKNEHCGVSECVIATIIITHHRCCLFDLCNKLTNFPGQRRVLLVNLEQLLQRRHQMAWRCVPPRQTVRLRGQRRVAQLRGLQESRSSFIKSRNQLNE